MTMIATTSRGIRIEHVPRVFIEDGRRVVDSSPGHRLSQDATGELLERIGNARSRMCHNQTWTMRREAGSNPRLSRLGATGGQLRANAAKFPAPTAVNRTPAVRN